jgi:hypothetical protein
MCEETVKTAGPMRRGIVDGSAWPVNRVRHYRTLKFFVRLGHGLRFLPRVNLSLNRQAGAPA